MRGRDPGAPALTDFDAAEARRLLEAARLDDVHALASREQTLQRVLSRWREAEPSRRGSTRVSGAAVLALAGVAASGLAAAWLGLPGRTQPAPEPSRHAAAHSKPHGPVLYRAACPNIVTASATTALIDDMEDGDPAILARDARAGVWRLAFDGTGPVSPFAGNLLPVAIPEGRGASRRALHVTGERLLEWGAFISAGLTPAGCYDASAYAGLEFWARGTKKLRIGVSMMDSVPTLVGGPCVENCNGGHVAVIDLAPDWTHYSLRWDELRVAAEQARTELDLKRLSAVTFGVSPDDTPFDLWLDDLAFSPR